MRDGRRRLVGILGALLFCLAPGCATMRRNASTPDLRPSSDGFAFTRDGWKLGIRHIRPGHPDPAKLPVVLCHGLGLNATFWTIADHHLPEQLAARGYEVFLPDLRGSGESAKVGRIGQINARRRQTPLVERGEGRWNIDEVAFYDVPAILDFVKRETGHDRVNWVGHSLGGMLMFPFLERSPESWRIASFVGMGSTVILADAPQRDMLRANRGLRILGRFVSTGRMGRPLMYIRFPGLDRIDQFYYTSSNVDRRTIQRFYGYTLEDPGRSALRQLDPYLEFGHMLSADRSIDYSARLDEVTVPTLLVAGESDSMSDVPSTELTLAALGSSDKTLMRFGRRDGQVADYGHCDLVWSRYAPSEIFPPLIDWLDHHQPVMPSAQQPRASAQQECASERARQGDAQK
ncbi:MAG: alpha/beta fold hydrolase [Planctomycetaceae bacterium]|nr:alpha/beta fold hydrolase [Planctomycetaceae bacterium]MBV8610530.1 alpha/beta fold hydrolase [Singulisphaera sp.]